MKVFFGIPSYQGLKCLPFLDSLIATKSALEEAGHEFALGLHIGCCWVQFARISLVKQFDDSGADVLFLADDDLSWEPRDAVRLVECGEEIVAGAYRRRGGAEGDFVVGIDTDEYGTPLGKNGPLLIQCTFAPTGFMRIKRSAIEKLYAAYPEKRFRQPSKDGPIDGYYDLFPQGVYEGQWYGEDSAFCRLWRAIGEKVWIMPDITLRHHSGKDVYEGNYHDFLMRCPGGSKA